jgi:thiamine-phosphate pyrophosphorylase
MGPLRTDDRQALWRTARALGGRRRGRAKLPPILFFTDPVRAPDPQAVVSRLPRGAGVVFRSFGALDSLERGRRLAQLARARGVMFLVGADVILASALKADGVHLPERSVGQPGRVLALRDRFFVTAAAHSWPAVLRARRTGVDAVVVSPVFTTRSTPARPTLGVLRFATMTRDARLPVYALGGINSRSVRLLLGSGAVGVALIEGLAG